MGFDEGPTGNDVGDVKMHLYPVVHSQDNHPCISRTCEISSLVSSQIFNGLSQSFPISN